MRRTVFTAFILLAAACVRVAEAPIAADTCGAADRTSLIGRNVAEIPAAPPGQSRRIIRPGDSVTEDYSDQRINYYLDGADRLVRITCG